MPNAYGLDEGYVSALNDRLALIEADLRQLSSTVKTRPLSRFEYVVLERDFQVLIEACLGLAKRLVKLTTNRATTESLVAFHIMQQGALDTLGLDWRAIIGMRNVIVHDYLNVNEGLVLEVLQSGEFWELFRFCRLYTEAST